MADPLVIISLASSALITPTVVAGYALAQQRREHRQALQAELRQVLDVCAEALSAQRRTYSALGMEWQAGENPTGERPAELFASHGENAERIWNGADRLAIRAGRTSEVYETYMHATGKLDAVRSALDAFERNEPHTGEAQRRFLTALNDLIRARQAFVDVAKQEADKPSLPDRKRRRLPGKRLG